MTKIVVFVYSQAQNTFIFQKRKYQPTHIGCSLNNVVLGNYEIVIPKKAILYLFIWVIIRYSVHFLNEVNKFNYSEFSQIRKKFLKITINYIKNMFITVFFIKYIFFSFL